MTPGGNEGDTRSMRERMAAGDPYLADDPELAELSSRAQDLVAAYNATTVRQAPPRRKLLEQLLGSIGEGTELRPPLHVDYGSNITVGARCFANFGLVALDVGRITIGDDVQFGPNVQLLTPTHPVEPEARRQKWEAAAPITIGDNVWLGGGAIVLPGVTIGANTVVGAGAVVTKDLPAGVVAVGNPARVVRTLDVPGGSAPVG
ncbi:sugar O-acetyltransferase [Blastococcus sp. SYSU DS0617]